jgi:predicted esterase
MPVDNLTHPCPIISPERPVSVHQGQHISCWFDTISLPPSTEEFDESGVSESVAMIDKLIQSQVMAGIDSQRIVLMGFSQGAALSMIIALTRSYSLGGIISLAGWIPPRARNVRIFCPKRLPVLICIIRDR